MSADAQSGDRVEPRQLWLVPTAGAAASQRVAEVAVNAPVAGLRAYAVPESLAAELRPGAWVRVPFGRSGRLTVGVCVRVSERPWDGTLRALQAVEPGPPYASERLLELALWVSDYYACWPWKTLTAMWPRALRRPANRRVRYVKAAGHAAPEVKLTSSQAALIEALAGGELPRTEALRRAGVSAATLRTLQRRGLVECRLCVEPVPPVVPPPAPAAPPHDLADDYALTEEQGAALRAVTEALDGPSVFKVLVLFGVPGSGKTEVYVRAIRAAVAQGRQAIVLIPEIALATQVVDRLARRFERVAVLHSQLPPRTRADTLAAIAAGAVSVVIGTRTAVFAPCPRLGLIVVDEEQETSFKSLASPYYHARDVAIKRGQLEHIPVVLGTATPSLETWYNAHHRPHYVLLRLPQRVPGARPPDVRRVAHPTAGEPTATGLLPPNLLSPLLRNELEAALANGDQAVLLQNRRGYAVLLCCTNCGLIVRCVRCGAGLVYHRDARAMKCHRCGHHTAVPTKCLDTSCGGLLRRLGAGIQRLEEEVRRTLPHARLLRLDSDTMRRRRDYEEALRRFEAGEADVLLGTQMVAKGLDFPRVRLVGVIDADAGLSVPDFRAGERVFQLIVQVVGRAGRRDGPSLAVVQTNETPSAVVQHALRLDYEAFAAEELALRARYQYPPFTRLARLVCADERPGRAAAEAERLANALRTRAERLDARLHIEPAEPCLVRQLRGWRRYQVVLRGPAGDAVRQLLQAAAGEKLLRPRVRRFTVDVDPMDWV